MDEKTLAYEFEIEMSGFAVVEVSARSEEEAREALANYDFDEVTTEVDFEDGFPTYASLLAVMDEDGEVV